MAKISWIERNRKKAETVKKYAALRAELKAKRDYAGLSKLPKRKIAIDGSVRFNGVSAGFMISWPSSACGRRR